MQKFNWLTMWMSNYYKKVNYDTETVDGSDSSESIVNYETELPKVQRSVDALKDDVTVGDDIEKEALNNAITRPFIKWINDYLKDKEEIKSNLINSIRQALVKYPEEKSLKNLETALVSKPEEISDKNIPQPEFKLDWLNTGEIKDMEDGGKESISSYIKKEKPEDDKQVPDNFKLYKTKAEALNLSDRINNLLKNEKLKENDNLNKTNELVENINKILNNLTKDNIKLLQNFIFNNLEEDKKEQFKKDNYYNENSNSFDGRLGKSTLWSLNDLWKKIEEYVSSLEKSNPANPESQEAEDLLKDVEVRGSINLPEWDTQIKAADLFDGTLPDGADPEFKDGKWINVQETTKSQEVTVVVKDSKDKVLGEIIITATVESDSNWSKKIKLSKKESWNSATVETTVTPTEPLKILVNDKEEQHPVANIEPASKFNGGVLYCMNSWNEVQNVNVDINWDTEYLMQMGDETYKVKLDNDGNLKPLVENFYTGDKVLIKNNQSCINYLRSRVPPKLQWNSKIAWNSKMEDYVIRLNGQETGLTIEPILIDWKWLWTSLEKNLAMLYFTNILRKTKWIDYVFFENDNPDLKWDDGKLLVKVKKNKDAKESSGSKHRYSVRLDDYALGFLRDDDVSRKNFLKYNNGEDWWDDWDKKKGNEYAKKP